MKPMLYENKSDCCACGACMISCPTNAIQMEPDVHGFLYPTVDNSLCIGCKTCMTVCRFNAESSYVTQGPWYAAAGKGDVSRSSSGGAFSSFAEKVVEDGGVVVGAAFVCESDEPSIDHVLARTIEEIDSLRDSKYVQSNAWNSYIAVKEELKKGTVVLFSGTPCQVAGLKGYLRKDWENLITVDLVCHGVPNQEMLRAWFSGVERKTGKRIVRVRFRDKTEGWIRSTSKVILSFSDGTYQTIDRASCAYYDLFLHVKLLRDSCYVCPFAGKKRPGDITIGDFWGIAKNCDDVLKDGQLSLDKGISCVLVNNSRGRIFIAKMNRMMVLKSVDFEDIAKGNPQLRHHSICPDDRVLYLDAYKNGGWNSIEHLWRRRERSFRYYARMLAKRLRLGKLRAAIVRLIAR